MPAEIEEDAAAIIEQLLPVGLSPPPLAAIKRAAPEEEPVEAAKLEPKKKMKKSSIQTSKKSDIQICQDQTMDILNKINGNLSRMADTQERMCSILEKFSLS